MNENEPLLQKESSSSQNQPKNPEKKPSNPQITSPSNRRKRNSGQTESLDQVLSRISNDFNDVKPVEDLAKLLKLNPGYIIMAFFVLIFLPIILGLWPKFFVNILGFLYPAYLSLKVSKTSGEKDRDNLKQWLTYWVAFMIFDMIDGVLMLAFTHFLPLFYPIKALFLIWMFYPKSKGASMLYEKVFRKLYEKLKDLRDDNVVDKKTEEFFKGSS
jgi:receptor expression-enhancing protein 5/6